MTEVHPRGQYSPGSSRFDTRQGSTVFIAGNHDFGFAAYLGSLPISGAPPLNLDATRKPEFTTGYYRHAVEGGMHYQGRRWGEGRVYNTHSTFSSYGVEFTMEPSAREALVCAVPEDHKAFLRALQWMHDETFSWGRLVCVHAGLDPHRPLEEQLRALAARDLAACVLHSGQPSTQGPAVEGADAGRISAFCNRRDVERMHPGWQVAPSSYRVIMALRGSMAIGSSSTQAAAGQPLVERCRR